jgi:hypothetical protein
MDRDSKYIKILEHTIKVSKIDYCFRSNVEMIVNSINVHTQIVHIIVGEIGELKLYFKDSDKAFELVQKINMLLKPLDLNIISDDFILPETLGIGFKPYKQCNAAS